MATRNINDLIATQKVANASYTLENGQIILTTGTITTSKPAVSATQTWNDAGVPFTGIKLNVTDTASAAASLLLDLQVGGASKANIDKSGNGILAGLLTVANGAVGAPSLRFANSASSGLYSAFAGTVSVSSVGVTELLLCANVGGGVKALRLRSGNALGWSSGNPDTNADDLTIYRDAANTLAQRNAANAQAFHLYGTFTDASNYRRLLFGSTTAGVFSITPVGAGTGAAGNVLHISGLPTSNPGPGILWNDTGAVAIGT